MFRICLVASALALLSCPAGAAPSRYSDLYGKQCRTTDMSARGSTRECAGVAGYALAVHDDDDRTSVDVIAPNRAVYPLSFWDVVTLGYASVGQKAEWVMGVRKNRPTPTALVVRLTRLDQREPGELVAVARLERDGACVVFKGDIGEPGVEAAAHKAAIEPGRKCLGPYTEN